MKRFLATALLMTAPLAFAQPAAAHEPTKCHITYDTKSWSLLYKTVDGTGHITCTNGQTASVVIRARGGGVTFGSSEVSAGTGAFSSVRDIADLFGNYVEVGAHAGAGASADAHAMMKSNVNLSIAGTGVGINLGFAFGQFRIEAP